MKTKQPSSRLRDKVEDLMQRFHLRRAQALLRARHGNRIPRELGRRAEAEAIIRLLRDHIAP